MCKRERVKGSTAALASSCTDPGTPPPLPVGRTNSAQIRQSRPDSGSSEFVANERGKEPAASKLGTNKTVKARSWPWPQLFVVQKSFSPLKVFPSRLMRQKSLKPSSSAGGLGNRVSWADGYKWSVPEAIAFVARTIVVEEGFAKLDGKVRTRLIRHSSVYSSSSDEREREGGGGGGGRGGE